MSKCKFMTMRHIETVRNYLNACVKELLNRAEQHDQSKLQSPEVEAFEELTPLLRSSVYGSQEYKDNCNKMKPAIDHHQSINRHHPEHFVLWKCVVCGGICTDAEKVAGPNDEGKVFYCPSCCKFGMIYEASLVRFTGINGMNLIDLLEMVCDWKAAGMRHATGDLMKSIDINQKRFGYSDEMAQILRNTATFLNDVNVYHQAQES